MPKLPSVAAVFFALLLTGCSGAQGPHPSRPDDAASIPVLLARADSASARGAPDEARAAYARAADEARRAGVRDLEFRARLGAGLASLALSEPDPARRSLARALELDPASAQAHDAMGRLHAATRRYLDAKNEFDRAAALDTVSAEPLYHLGLAYVQAGNPKLAAEAFTRALARNPDHAPTQAALSSVLESRYTAAGLPEGYAALRTHPSVSRGELAVMLAAELGADPERPSWRGGKDQPLDTEEARGAWGERWVRVSMARGWIKPFPDGSYHLGDPVTRGAMALLLTGIAGNGAAASSRGIDRFSDLGARHYLARAAETAVEVGLPLRQDGRFEPSASATGSEAFAALKGLAKRLGVEPVISEEPRQDGVVK